MDSVTEQLAQLNALYLSQLPAKLEEIVTAHRLLDTASWNFKDAENLHRLLHSLTGTAGTFGFPSLSVAARAAEKLIAPYTKAARLPNTQEWQQFDAELLRLLQHLRGCISAQVDIPAQPSMAAQENIPTPPLPVLDDTPLIHIIEDESEQQKMLQRILGAANYRVQSFADLSAYRRHLADRSAPAPDAIVVDMELPEGKLAGTELIADLKTSHPAHCPPVVIISALDNMDARLLAFRAGASRYLTKPLPPAKLVNLLDELCERMPPQPYRVLLVDDDEQQLAVHAAILREAGMEVHALAHPLQTLQFVQDIAPDVVVLDVYMTQASGPEIAAILRENEILAQLPILFLSAETNITEHLLALNLGGDDFLVKPVKPEHLIAAITARARRSRQISTIHRQLQTQLYEREREHLALNQHAIVSITDLAGNITYINDKFCEISGYTPAELLGQSHRILKSGMHPPEFYRMLWLTITSGRVWHGEICNRRKDGTQYWVESTITPFMDSNGKPYQYVSIRTDISRIKQSAEALRASEMRLNLAQQVSHVGNFEWHPKSGELNWSDEHYRLWGLVPGSVMPSFELFKAAIHADDVAHMEQQLQAAMQDGKMFNIVYRIRRPDGSEHIMHSRGEFSYDENGEATQLTGTVQDITEHARIEREIALSKERLRRGQEFANIGTWDWNILNGELYWTERIAPLFGYAVGELDTTYENFINAIHPDDRQKVTDAVTACVEHDAPYNIEHRVVWPDGTVRWLQERGAVARDAHGKPLQMLGVVQDIDDRKRAELALIERERELREAQTLARIGNWSANMLTGELHWSDEIYRIFGHAPRSFAPSVEIFMNAVHPDDRELVQASEVRAQQTGRHDVVHRIILPDGRIRHVHELAQAELDADSKLVRLSGTVQDITERIEAEAKLHESEERFAFAVEGAGDGVWDWDIQSGAMQLSGHYEDMLDYKPGELEPTIDAWVASVHPDDLPEVQQTLQDYLAGKLDTYTVELRLQCKDGGYKWILCRGTIVERERNGQPLRMIGIHSDISARKKVEQALILASEEANRASKAKSDFLSSMSHELRTPMNAILGFGQLLQYDETLSAEHKDSVQEILHAGEHLLELINDVLDLSKIEAGSIDLSLEPVDLYSIIEECLMLITGIAAKRNIQVSHSNTLGAVVRADRTRLKQVLLNLLSNAVKYNRAGGTIHLDVKIQNNGMLQIRVADSGHGIPAARIRELFQPFNRLDAETSGIEGTGIGLTITRRIVEMMGGSVDVISEVGVGSTFWIELPIESSFEHHYPQPGHYHADSLPDAQGTPHVVLYIEDNPSNLRLMSQILGRRKNLRLITAHTPDLGIELAQAHQPELILLDINMPGLDGYQVLEIIRKVDVLAAIPVVAVTANAMPRDIERGIAAGFSDYLTKPIDIAFLYNILDKHLDSPRPLVT